VACAGALHQLHASWSGPLARCGTDALASTAMNSASSTLGPAAHRPPRGPPLFRVLPEFEVDPNGLWVLFSGSLKVEDAVWPHPRRPEGVDT